MNKRSNQFGSLVKTGRKKFPGPTMQKPVSRLRIEDLTTSNEAMARCLQLAALAAKTDVPVVLLGETGTGKTLLAHAIHNSSARAGRPFIAFQRLGDQRHVA